MAGPARLRIDPGTTSPVPKPRVLFLNRSYRPDAEATGQLLTELAEDLAADGGWNVAVLCGRPNANPGGEPAACGTAVRNGVTVHRVRHTKLAGGAKRSLALRAVDYFAFLLAALLRGAVVRRPDLIVAETDPFPLAVVGRLLAWRHRARFVIHAQDIHPELGVALGILKPNPAVKLVAAAMHAAARRADAVVTLSRDMRRTFRTQGVRADRVAVVPNWTDAAAVVPVRRGNRVRRELGLGEPGTPGATFAVMHSGNMGRTQRLGDLLAAADRLRHRADILFLLVGGGAAEADLKAEAARRGLPNVRFLPYRPKAELAESLSAADLHLVSTDARAVPFLMPSKLYGVLAAGVPAVCVAPAGSELAATVEGEPLSEDEPGGEPCGWAVEPGDVAGLAAAIAAAADADDAERRALGDAGRRLCEGRFSRAALTPRFGAALRAVLAGRPAAGAVRAEPAVPATRPLPAGRAGGKDRHSPAAVPAPVLPDAPPVRRAA